MSDAVVLLTTDPRPPFAAPLSHLAGEAFEMWVGNERRVRYRVYKDDADEDVAVVVFGVI